VLFIIPLFSSLWKMYFLNTSHIHDNSLCYGHLSSRTRGVTTLPFALEQLEPPTPPTLPNFCCKSQHVPLPFTSSTSWRYPQFHVLGCNQTWSHGNQPYIKLNQRSARDIKMKQTPNNLRASRTRNAGKTDTSSWMV
jgi:hypothetical protein